MQVFFQCLHMKELQRQKAWQPQDMVVYVHEDVCQTLVRRSIRVKFGNIQGLVFMWNLLSCGGLEDAEGNKIHVHKTPLRKVIFVL